MRTTDEKCLHFVLRHYQKNKLDTQKASKAFKEKYQIPEQEQKSFRLWWILPGIAAAILVAVLIYPRFRENGAWKEVTAYSHPVDYMLPDSSSITLFRILPSVSTQKITGNPAARFTWKEKSRFLSSMTMPTRLR